MSVVIQQQSHPQLRPIADLLDDGCNCQRRNKGCGVSCPTESLTIDVLALVLRDEGVGVSRHLKRYSSLLLV
jgi:hypothetical protein